MFNRKCLFEFDKIEGMNIEELEFELIDSGLEEIEELNDKIFIYGDYTAFGELSTALEGLNIDVTKSSLERIPTSPLAFTETELIDIEKMLDKIEDDDDIQQVFTNIE
jgi:transcriptional/translational regulatory protein YebC/TACO1